MPTALDEATFMALRIAAADDVADGIRRFELVHPEGHDLPTFTPGSHISLLAPNGAKRKYSLCNDAAERHRYVISVKREVGGRGGSISLIDGARVGDTAARLAARQRLSAGRQGAALRFHRWRHRHHADPVDDPLVRTRLRRRRGSCTTCPARPSSPPTSTS